MIVLRDSDLTNLEHLEENIDRQLGTVVAFDAGQEEVAIGCGELERTGRLDHRVVEPALD